MAEGEYGVCLIRVAVDEYAFAADIFHTFIHVQSSEVMI